MEKKSMSSFELYQHLTKTLKEGKQRAKQLSGFVRKLPSVNSVMLMKRDDAKETLNAYWNKLTDCLLEFRSNMFQAMEDIIQEKQDELTSLKMRYEDDIKTLLMLCKETEKLVQIGNRLDNPPERVTAKALLTAFHTILARQPEDCCKKNLFDFYVRTTLELDDITPRMFGHISRSSCPSFEQDVEESGTNLVLGRGFEVKETLTRDQSTQTIESDVVSECKVCAKYSDNEKLTQTETQFGRDAAICNENSLNVTQSPGFPVYVAVPNASPVHFINYSPTLQSAVPNLANGQYLIGGTQLEGINENNLMPMFQDNPFTVFNQVSMSGDNLVPQSTDYLTKRNYENKQTKFPPGFSPEIIEAARNLEVKASSFFNANCSSIDEVSSDINRSLNRTLSKQKMDRIYDDKNEPKELSSFTPNLADMNICHSVYTPPPVPDFVKDLKKKMYVSEMYADRKPLRRPFREPGDISNGNPVFHHSTPIKRMTYADSENNNIRSREVEAFGENNQSLINSPTKSTKKSNEVDRDDNFLGLKEIEIKEERWNDSKHDDEIPTFETGSNLRLEDDIKQSSSISLEVNKQALEASRCNLSTILTTKQHSKRIEHSDISTNKIRNISVCASSQDWDDAVMEKNDYIQSDANGNTKELTDKNITTGSQGNVLNNPCCSFVKDATTISENDNIACHEATGATDSDLGNLLRNNGDDSGVCVDERNLSQQTETEDLEGNTSPRRYPKHEKGVHKADVCGTTCRALNNAVKQYLGDSKHSRSKRGKLGPLQAHWLKNCHGIGTFADMDAKFEFKFKSDFHFPIGLTSDKEKNILVADTGNHVIKMFDVTGQLICEIGKDLPMKRPSAIVVNELCDIFVKDDICIRVFDKKGSHTRDIGKSFFKKPFGLAMTPAKNLLVLETHHSDPSLVHMSQNGKSVLRYLYTPLVNAHPMSKCRFIGVSDNNVIVSDLGISQVYITTLEGEYLTRLGMFGYGLMQFCEPSGIAVDNYGNVLIGDSKNNRIQIYRYDGSYTGLLRLDKPVVRPSGIHLSPDNKLMVVNFLDSSVKVYQL